MSTVIPTALQPVVAARRAFFDHGTVPENVIDEAIFRSWSRCVAGQRLENEVVQFEEVRRSFLSELMERNQRLLKAAHDPLTELANVVAGAGYAVLLTDSYGHALSVAGRIHHSEPAMRAAFRAGVDLSEQAIGTSAMACAIAERRAVRVWGPEHYFAANQIFHCVAAPIVDTNGNLIGSLDITRHSPMPDYGALSLVSQCAQAIELQLFHQLRPYLTLALSWRQKSSPGDLELIIAFGSDGEIVALNDEARSFLAVTRSNWPLHSEDVIEGTFGELVGALRKNAQHAPIRMRSGLRLHVSRWDLQAEPTPAPSVPAVDKSVRRNPSTGRGSSVAPLKSPIPEFGDPAISRQIEAALRAQAGGLPLLIRGETGTGKEVVATTLHANGLNAKGRLLAINCAALPESLIEGELFGHVDGAFTGARRNGAPGKIEMAHGGTLFLDEIGDMPLNLQARLLRVLETREVTRLGSSVTQKVEFQLIAATNQDIAQAVNEGRFRIDLFYRLKGFTLELSALRHRPGLPALIATLLAQLSSGSRQLTADTERWLCRYPWPGNVRELKNALAYAHAMAEPGHPLEPADFASVLDASETSPAETGEHARHPQGLLNEVVEEATQQALQQCDGNVRQAAQLLGISTATLYRRLKRRKSP